mgnify:CR=1 FL=1
MVQPDIDVPADISSAAFFLALGALAALAFVAALALPGAGSTENAPEPASV